MSVSPKSITLPLASVSFHVIFGLPSLCLHFLSCSFRVILYVSVQHEKPHAISTVYCTYKACCLHLRESPEEGWSGVRFCSHTAWAPIYALRLWRSGEFHKTSASVFSSSKEWDPLGRVTWYGAGKTLRAFDQKISSTFTKYYVHYLASHSEMIWFLSASYYWQVSDDMVKQTLFLSCLWSQAWAASQTYHSSPYISCEWL